MKQATIVLRAASLFSDLDDLLRRKQLRAQDVAVFQQALTSLIAAQLQPTLPDPALPPLIYPERTYLFQERSDAFNRVRVHVAEQPDRLLPRIAIFAFDLGLEGHAAYDTALTILADSFGERLSRQAFAEGGKHYCRYYVALATLLPQMVRGGVLTSLHLFTFLKTLSPTITEPEGENP